MILPSKHLGVEDSLLGVGAEVLQQVQTGRTVSEIWEHFRMESSKNTAEHSIPFDWFLLALSLLYAMGAINFHKGVITIRSAE